MVYTELSSLGKVVCWERGETKRYWNSRKSQPTNWSHKLKACSAVPIIDIGKSSNSFWRGL